MAGALDTGEWTCQSSGGQHIPQKVMRYRLWFSHAGGFSPVPVSAVEWCIYSLSFSLWFVMSCRPQWNTIDTEEIGQKCPNTVRLSGNTFNPQPHWRHFPNGHHWGGGLFRAPPPPSELRNYRTDSKHSSGIRKPWKHSRGTHILLASGSRVPSQVRSKSKCSTFPAWWHRRAEIAMLSTNKAN